ncbi:MAG: pyruvate flavodoxin/ferredoxin oxidoreductase [Bacteroidetes bacterium]|nr:pyruvate flavodoxin/ferredoxin oxidoreductase [Bacteroidota bacterium]
MIQFIDGNEALVQGALKAGCNFFAGYPITPATPILLSMMTELPARGETAIQGEDEIASIGFCIGAAMTGKKALTATSGPGLSLYSENIGLAIMGEVPLVIVDVQRLGPATGSATKDASMDIQFVRWITSGGYPAIALAPSSVEDCYLLAIHAFNYAEKYRTPVFILSSKEIGQTRMRVDLDLLTTPAIIKRESASQSQNGKVKSVSFNNSSFQPICTVGGDELSRFTGSSHDEYGNLTKSPGMIEKLNEHLNTKINPEEVALWEYSGPDLPETLIISYGIVSRSVNQALKTGSYSGVGHLILKTLWPVPETILLKYLSSADTIIIPEMNNGQYALEIERLKRHDSTLISIQQVNSELLAPERITEALKEVSHV